MSSWRYLLREVGILRQISRLPATRRSASTVTQRGTKHHPDFPLLSKSRKPIDDPHKTLAFACAGSFFGGMIIRQMVTKYEDLLMENATIVDLAVDDEHNAKASSFSYVEGTAEEESWKNMYDN